METLEISIDMTQLFTGAEVFTTGLSAPFLFITGLGLGVAILGAIVKGITMVKM